MNNQFKKNISATLVGVYLLSLYTPPLYAREDVLFETPPSMETVEKINNGKINIIPDRNPDSSGVTIIHSEEGLKDRVYKMNSTENGSQTQKNNQETADADVLFKQEGNNTSENPTPGVKIGGIDGAIQRGDLQTLQGLSNFNVNQETFNGNTVLHIAAKNKNIELFKFAVDKGANLSKKNKSGWTWLQSAVHAGDLNFVRKAKEIVPQANWQEMLTSVDNEKRSVLHILFVNPYTSTHEEMTQFLITESSQLINIKDKNNQTPVIYAVTYSEWKSVRPMLKAGASLSIKLNESEDETYKDMLVRLMPIWELPNVFMYLDTTTQKEYVATIDRLTSYFKDDERFRKMIDVIDE